MYGGGFHAAGCNPHGIIQGYVHLFGMGASAPYWSGILCAAVNNCKGCCSEGFSIYTPSRSRQASDKVVSCHHFST